MSERSKRPWIVVSLTWLTLTAVAATVYVLRGIRVADPAEAYTQLWSFQMFAFFYTRSFFLAGGGLVMLFVTNWTRVTSSVPTLVGMSTAFFLICEIAACGVWGR